MSLPEHDDDVRAGSRDAAASERLEREDRRAQRLVADEAVGRVTIRAAGPQVVEVLVERLDVV